ncbi:DUF488 family protein [Ilumatobacter sp.]|uniref:DUF488 domain-containing protein n=2 Tax=Ilumatobacter sp. TaxID=1967498 RepID=UPI00375013CA
MMTPRTVLTVGHSAHSLDSFIALLAQHQVSAIADVRSTPFSRFTPQFNRESVKQELARHKVGYAFLGRELGARSNDPNCYEDGRVQYARLAATKSFHEGIERLRTGADRDRIALMCTEKDPLDCHRTLLVARALHEEGVNVEHIHADGHLETHEDAMLRLLDKFGLLQANMFRTNDDLLHDALQQQEARIAYVDESLVPSAESVAR